jgi:hypothetical protein
MLHHYSDKEKILQDSLAVKLGDLKVESWQHTKYWILFTNCHTYAKWLNSILIKRDRLESIFHESRRVYETCFATGFDAPSRIYDTTNDNSWGSWASGVLDTAKTFGQDILHGDYDHWQLYSVAPPDFQYAYNWIVWHLWNLNIDFYQFYETASE